MYNQCGHTAGSDPDTIWKVHDYLAQAYDSVNDTKQEIDHYQMAITILTECTTAPPEVTHCYHQKSKALQYIH